MGTPAFRRPQGFRSLSQIVFIQSLSNLVNMLVGIISRPCSITSQIPQGTPELCPLNLSEIVQNEGFRSLTVLVKKFPSGPYGEYVGGP